MNPSAPVTKTLRPAIDSVMRLRRSGEKGPGLLEVVGRSDVAPVLVHGKDCYLKYSLETGLDEIRDMGERPGLEQTQTFGRDGIHAGVAEETLRRLFSELSNERTIGADHPVGNVDAV